MTASGTSWNGKLTIGARASVMPSKTRVSRIVSCVWDIFSGVLIAHCVFKSVEDALRLGNFQECFGVFKVSPSALARTSSTRAASSSVAP